MYNLRISYWATGGANDHEISNLKIIISFN